MLPVVTLRALAEEADKRGLTFTQLLGLSISEFLKNHPVEEG